jgi:hypothetical protein
MISLPNRYVDLELSGMGAPTMINPLAFINPQFFPEPDGVTTLLNVRTLLKNATAT